MKHSNSKSSAFTLLELLIVIAILALLVSILVPSLSRAKQLAKKAICLSNVRYLAVSNHMYAEYNNGYFVLASEDIWSTNLLRWHGRRNNANEAFDPQRSPLIQYMGAAGLKECPSFVKGTDYSDNAGQGTGFEAGCGGYGYNQQYIGGRNDLYGIGDQASHHSARLEDIRCASNTVMFTDCAYVAGTGGSQTKIAYSFCEPPFWEFGNPGGPSDMRPDPSIDFRHLSQANVAWADGHATSQDLSFTVSYQTHSMINGEEAKSQGIGWFGPQSNELFDLK